MTDNETNTYKKWFLDHSINKVNCRVNSLKYYVTVDFNII